MQLIAPDYYPKFHCIAGDCKHSCCIGWEIDIDDATAQIYKKQPGAFGDRLRSSIRFSDAAPCFRLTEGNRCPFLNEKGLCDIILTLGEVYISQVCTDHPRFRNFFSHRTEIGLGLCCEEAARLILTQKEKTCFTVLKEEEGGEEPWEEETELLQKRGELIAIWQDRTLPLPQRIEKGLNWAGISLPRKTPAQWAQVFLGLEILDEEWSRRLQAVTDEELASLPAAFDIPFEQLLVYFTYRHLPGGTVDEIPVRAAFAVLGYEMIRRLCQQKLAAEGACTLEDLIDIARAYSAEVEYAQENIDELLSLPEPAP